MSPPLRTILPLCVLSGVAACSSPSRLSVMQGTGPDPALPAPDAGGNVAVGADAHVAPLGLAFNTGDALPSRFANGAFIGLHGSWNRKPVSGYAVIFVPFAQGQPNAQPEPVLAGFLADNGDAYGRPVGVILDARGVLLVADDVGNAVFRISRSTNE